MNKRERALAWLVLAVTAILFTASLLSDGSDPTAQPATEVTP